MDTAFGMLRDYIKEVFGPKLKSVQRLGLCWYIIYIEFLLNSTFSLVVNTPRPQAQINCLILEPIQGLFINVDLSCFASIS